MHLQLDPCRDEDMHRVFAIVSDSFEQRHPFPNYIFPKHWTPEGRKSGAERLLAAKHGSSNITFLKVTDKDTGKIVATAEWNVFRNKVPEEAGLDGDFWDSQEEKELAQETYEGYMVPRRKALRESGGNLLGRFFPSSNCVSILDGQRLN